MYSNEKGSLQSLLLTASVIAFIILSTYLFPEHFDFDFSFFNRFFSRVYEVKKVSEHLPVSTESTQSLEISEIVALRQLLHKKQYVRLNSVLEAYQNSFDKDQTNEYQVYDAYQTFYLTVSSYEDLLNKWMDTTPDTYQPYVAMAQFYYANGWESRGYKSSQDTSTKQFEQMADYFSKAEKNLKTALDMNPNLMIAYHTLIGIYNANGQGELEDWVVEQTSELFPHSFLMKTAISWAKEPRWGGRYEEMELLAKQAEKYADINPKIPLLYGFIYSDQAANFRRNEKHEKALELYTKALGYGDHWSFYNERAKLYHYYLKSYDKALKDVNRSIHLRSTVYENHLMRSKINFAIQDFSESIKDMQTAETIKLEISKIQKWKKWASDNLVNRGHQIFKNDPEGAIDYYDLSLEYSKDNFQAYYWRGRAFANLKNLESALPDFKIAIEIDPRHFESYLMVDYIYAQNRQWSEIISYWDKFIALEPDNADAYFERAGTHYHNKNMESSINDLKTACDLGNEKACKRYNMVKK